MIHTAKRASRKSAAKKPAKKSARKVVAKKATRKGSAKKASPKKMTAEKDDGEEVCWQEGRREKVGR